MFFLLKRFRIYITIDHNISTLIHSLSLTLSPKLTTSTSTLVCKRFPETHITKVGTPHVAASAFTLMIVDVSHGEWCLSDWMKPSAMAPGKLTSQKSF